VGCPFTRDISSRERGRLKRVTLGSRGHIFREFISFSSFLGWRFCLHLKLKEDFLRTRETKKDSEEVSALNAEKSGNETG